MRKLVFVVMFLLAVFTVLNAWSGDHGQVRDVQTITALDH